MLWACLFTSTCVCAQPGKTAREYYEINVYHFVSDSQEMVLDSYLRDAYLPALYKTGIRQAGVFKPVANDTSADKKIYVFIPSTSVNQFFGLSGIIEKDSVYAKAARNYLNATYDHPPFQRMETILLQAFRLAPRMKRPGLQSDKKEHIYELRSYESATGKLHENKMSMFNEGGEIALFKRLGFNAVFYADVISGSRMPNLMYMTCFENQAERDAHWKTFSSDPEWKRLSSLPEYQHNVSKADIILMHAAPYSGF